MTKANISGEKYNELKWKTRLKTSHELYQAAHPLSGSALLNAPSM